MEWRNLRLPRWAVVMAAAFLYCPLLVDWCVPGEGLHLACQALHGSEGAWQRFPLWSALVRLAGHDVRALGCISLGSALLAVAFLSAVFGRILSWAACKAEVFGIRNEFMWVENAALALVGAAFAFTPGLLLAATRVSPLMTALLPPLAALALVLEVVTGDVEPDPGDVAAPGLLLRLRRGWAWLLLATVLLAYSGFEAILARRILLPLALPALAVFFVLGAMPALIVAWFVRRRWLLGWRRRALVLGPWALAVGVLATVSFTSGRLDEGRAGNRIVAGIVANAAGKAAVASDGVLDDMLSFMLPEGVRIISLARDRDPAYGRELAEWVGKRANRTAPALGSASRGGRDGTVTEDLVFAAELGPSALLEEWEKLDRAGFEAEVLTLPFYIPTREAWAEACDALEGMGSGGPSGRYFRRLVAACGNALGCRLLRQGDRKGAWETFRAVADRVDRTCYAAYLNLAGMVERGYPAPKDEADEIARRRREIEGRLKSWDEIVGAARSGGELYVSPEAAERYEQEKRAAAREEPSPEAAAFMEAVAAAPKDPQSGRRAQEAIRKALREGKVKLAAIGDRLLTIDTALRDYDSVEKDAIDLLCLDRHNPTANAAIGSLNCSRGDYARAERYLRRALATGKASIAAKNDLAYALLKLDRADEAEPLARAAVAAYGESWAIRETLAAVLIRLDRIDEAEREFAKAEELAAKAGIPAGRIVELEIDRARILRARKDMERFKMKIRTLKNREDLTEAQRAEVGAMDW